MIAGFRGRTGLVRAALLYSEGRPQAPFVRRKEQVEIQGFEPDPPYAVRYAMVGE